MIKTIAFYLPQFHPTPENDEWWGAGFTEWTNVTKARPLFPGHHQPRVPADLGFCDLRVPETREAQANLAAEHGLSGFCYYHYWFNGKRLLGQPLDEVLQSGEPDFPFCLCWANETWSRRWLGEEKDILQEQSYSPEDDLNHGEWLATVFSDSRYIKLGGRPVFLIYRPGDLPRPQSTTEALRRACAAKGLENPYLIGVNAHCWTSDCRELGFDHTLDFMPQLGNLPEMMSDEPSETKRKRNRKLGVDSADLKLYDYSEAMESMLSNRGKLSHPAIPSMFVGWDSTPRREENAIVLVNDSPELFEHYLRQVVATIDDSIGAEELLFINSWNEWAEGNYLEPDDRFGTQYLEAVRRVLVERR